MFKHFSTKPKPGQLSFENQTVRKNIQPVGSITGSGQQQKPEEIPVSNRFESLQTDVEDQFIF